MKNIRFFAGFCFLTMWVFFSECTGAAAAGNEIGDKNSPKKVLIVSENGVKNDPVFSKVIDILKKDNCYIFLSGRRKISDTATHKFRAVVIVNDKKANRRLTVFLSEPEQRKIILFNRTGVKYGDSGKIADTLVEKIRLLLGVVK